LVYKKYIFNFFDKNLTDEEFMNDFKRDNRNNNTGLHLKYTPIKICAFPSSVKQCVIYGHYNSGYNNQHYSSLILRDKNEIFEPIYFKSFVFSFSLFIVISKIN
jgi:hypothetical protein